MEAEHPDPIVKISTYGGFLKLGYPKINASKWKILLKYIKMDDLGVHPF